MWNHAAFVDEKSAPTIVREAPYPDLKPGHVIIKNAAIALNHIDWKLQDFGFLVQSWPTVLGSDVAGEVIDVGEDVQGIQKGQRVIGHCIALLTGNNAEAAFQKYTLVPANLVAPIPDAMSFATAVVLPLSVSCASAALFEKNALHLPFPNLSTVDTGKSVLIWGGSSSVGSSAIQLARASGLKVIATASAKNFDYVKGLGAAYVLDYMHSNVVSQLVATLQGSDCVGAFDTVGSSIEQCAMVLEQLGGGHVVATADPPETLPAGVTANHVFATSIKDNGISKAIYQDYLPIALADGSFKPTPEPTIVGEGLEVLQAGLDHLKKGISATKLVVTL